MKQYIKASDDWESMYEDEVINFKRDGDTLYQVTISDDRGNNPYVITVYAPDKDSAVKQAVAYCDKYGYSEHMYSIEDLDEYGVDLDDPYDDGVFNMVFVDATEYGASQGYYIENISVKKASDADFIANEIIETLYTEHPDIDFVDDKDSDNAVYIQFYTKLSDDEFKNIVLSLFPQYADRLKFGQSHYRYAPEICRPYIAIMK